jgi:hypothetical protein
MPCIAINIAMRFEAHRYVYEWKSNDLLIDLILVVTVFCHQEGVDFWQFFSVKNCK